MTKQLKIAAYQINSQVGDLSGNTTKLIAGIYQAKAAGADLFLAPELAISGYPPEDLLLRPEFYRDCQLQLDTILAIDGITMLIGCPYQIGNEHFNSMFAIRDGHILGRYDKMLLPNYGVFDECRYFSPGASSLVIEVNQLRCGIIICEDLWDTVPIAEAAEQGAELILVANASPFEAGKFAQRVIVAGQRVEETELPLLYLNQVGGQDELVFDGASFALNPDGSMAYLAPAFREELIVLDFKQNSFAPGVITGYPDRSAGLYQALVLALSDYVTKNGFKGIVLGLSGGIDSALTLAIAVDALGKERVLAVMMPSEFTAAISVADSREMVAILGVNYQEIAIQAIFEQFKQGLSPVFAGLGEDSTEENLQARIRGTLLMAIANKTGHMLVSTGNKSEMTTGYATLYGDMAGGFALLKDLVKTSVYELANWRNQQSWVIPERIITRPPTAELRADQCDQDSLPEYALLDGILIELIEHKVSVAQIIAKGYHPEDVKRVAHLLKNNEHKRRQAAVGPKLTPTNFGKDWRYPISSKYGF